MVKFEFTVAIIAYIFVCFYLKGLYIGVFGLLSSLLLIEIFKRVNKLRPWISLIMLFFVSWVIDSYLPIDVSLVMCFLVLLIFNQVFRFMFWLNGWKHS